MHMRINQSRTDELPLHVYLLDAIVEPSTLLRVHRDDLALLDPDGVFPVHELATSSIDNGRVDEVEALVGLSEPGLDIELGKTASQLWARKMSWCDTYRASLTTGGLGNAFA